MLDAVSGEGCKPEKWYAQAASWSIVDHPGQVWDRAPTLLWWGFTAKSLAHAHSDPWTPAELRILRESGLEIERPAQAVVREANSWRQALLNVANNVMLCRTRIVHGELAPIHPLWHELEELISSCTGSIVVQAHKVLGRAQSQLAGQTLNLSYVSAKDPPQAHRSWTAPKGRISQRPEESVSSMRELFGCPMAWVLRYQAQLHPGILLTVPDGDQLVGDIAHELFRQLFQQKTPHDEISRRAGELFDELVATIGLPLLQRGRNVERESAKRLLTLAAQHFSKIIRDSDLDVVACEARKEATFGEGKFVGDVDVLLKTKDGSPIIVDYKWSKRIRYRIEEIEKSQHLQLAAYSWLESISTGAFAHAGYYMLRQRRLLHCGEGQLKIGEHMASPPLENIWQSIEAAYRSAIGSLHEGSICATGVPETETPVTPAGQTIPSFSLDPPCKVCDYGNICGVKRLIDA